MLNLFASSPPSSLLSTDAMAAPKVNLSERFKVIQRNSLRYFGQSLAVLSLTSFGTPNVPFLGNHLYLSISLSLRPIFLKPVRRCPWKVCLSDYSMTLDSTNQIHTFAVSRLPFSPFEQRILRNRRRRDGKHDKPEIRDENNRQGEMQGSGGGARRANTKSRTLSPSNLSPPPSLSSPLSRFRST